MYGQGSLCDGYTRAQSAERAGRAHCWGTIFGGRLALQLSKRKKDKQAMKAVSVLSFIAYALFSLHNVSAEEPPLGQMLGNADGVVDSLQANQKGVVGAIAAVKNNNDPRLAKTKAALGMN